MLPPLIGAVCAKSLANHNHQIAISRVADAKEHIKII